MFANLRVCKTDPNYKDTHLLVKRAIIRAMVFNVTFNNISVILWQSVSLVKEIGEPGTHNLSGDRH
jgi:hypothetical protein